MQRTNTFHREDVNASALIETNVIQPEVGGSPEAVLLGDAPNVGNGVHCAGGSGPNSGGDIEGQQARLKVFADGLLERHGIKGIVVLW